MVTLRNLNIQSENPKPIIRNSTLKWRINPLSIENYIYIARESLS